MTSTTPAPSGRGPGCRSAAASAVRRRGLDDRRHDPRADHGDGRADAESGEHVAGVVRAGGHPRHPDQAGQQGQAQSQRRALQPDADGEGGRAGRVARRQRVRRRHPAGPPDERHRRPVRPRPLPHALGHLVGEQARHGQRRDTPGGAALRRSVARRAENGGDGEPQLRVVGRRGEPRHDRIEQRAGGLRDRLEDLAVERAETLRRSVGCLGRRRSSSMALNLAEDAARRNRV